MPPLIYPSLPLIYPLSLFWRTLHIQSYPILYSLSNISLCLRKTKTLSELPLKVFVATPLSFSISNLHGWILRNRSPLDPFYGIRYLDLDKALGPGTYSPAPWVYPPGLASFHNLDILKTRGKYFLRSISKEAASPDLKSSMSRTSLSDAKESVILFAKAVFVSFLIPDLIPVFFAAAVLLRPWSSQALLCAPYFLSTSHTTFRSLLTHFLIHLFHG